MIEIALQKHIVKTKLNKVFTDFLSSFWDQYDENKNGKLEKDEFQKFILDIFSDDIQQNPSKKTEYENKIQSMF